MDKFQKELTHFLETNILFEKSNIGDHEGFTYYDGKGELKGISIKIHKDPLVCQEIISTNKMSSFDRIFISFAQCESLDDFFSRRVGFVSVGQILGVN
jgi:hypothetical protein